ncbi:alpha/beta hydrolase fold domain-containing protein [Thaumasiovibrio subtropicus]|uniref:alpha/beta hydrolase fold domain-containing protein n=1 Tax=Thaumasiovibrio subtropicus TaxID=1891207 RepID=UPI000B3572B5|nr:alpha/beta hydrolase fold domain-containing protein [Thaumasiovibrio subtropicus]
MSPLPAIEDFLHQAQLKSLNRQKTRFPTTPISARETLSTVTNRYVPAFTPFPQAVECTASGYCFNVSVRVYHPNPEQALPVAVYAHGGSPVTGSVVVYDNICRQLAYYTNHIIIAPEFRLAPEARYPAALEDVYTAVKQSEQILNQLEISYLPQLSVIGEGAGGALIATVVQQLQHERDTPLYRQVLIYPALDYTLAMPSVSQNSGYFWMGAETIKQHYDDYFHPADNRYNASPLYGVITPEVPDSLVITASYCPFRDEGIAYADRLTLTGVTTEKVQCAQLIHGFLNLQSLVPDQCNKVYRTISRFLNQP